MDNTSPKLQPLLELFEKGKLNKPALRLAYIKQIVQWIPKDVISEYGMHSYRTKLGKYVEDLVQWTFECLEGGIVDISLGIQLILFAMKLDLPNIADKFGV